MTVSIWYGSRAFGEKEVRQGIELSDLHESLMKWKKRRKEIGDTWKERKMSNLWQGHVEDYQRELIERQHRGELLPDQGLMELNEAIYRIVRDRPSNWGSVLGGQPSQGENPALSLCRPKLITDLTREAQTVETADLDIIRREGGADADSPNLRELPSVRSAVMQTLETHTANTMQVSRRLDCVRNARSLEPPRSQAPNSESPDY